VITPQYAPRKIRTIIEVSSGSGSVPFQATGYLKRIIITPPSDATQYLWQIVDGDGDGVDGINTPMTGPRTLNVDDAIIGSNQFSIISSSVDGQFEISMYFEDKSR
jgi:hypothetical protein